MKRLFSTRATATGGRSGRTQSEDGRLAFDLSMPGSGGAGTNPEQLFALGYAACFDSAVKLTAQRLRLPLTASRTTAEVGLGQLETGGYALEVSLSLVLQGLSQDDAQALAEAAHRVCPYSNALRGNVDVRLQVEVEP